MSVENAPELQADNHKKGVFGLFMQERGKIFAGLVVAAIVGPIGFFGE